MSRPNIPTLALAAGVLLSPVVGVPSLGAQTVYKPGTSRYSVDQAVDARQTMQGQSMQSTAHTRQVVSLSLAPASEGLTFTLVVDSASTQIEGVPPAQVAAANEALRQMLGRPVTGAVSAHGKVGEAALADSGEADTQLLAGARSFLPVLPNGGLAAGSSWNDSTATSFDNNGVVGTTTLLSRSRVTGDTTVGGVPAWRVERSGTLRMSGKGMSQGTDVELDGAGELKGHFYVSKDGVFLGGDQELSQNMTLTVPAVGLTIPIEQKVTTKMKRIG